MWWYEDRKECTFSGIAYPTNMTTRIWTHEPTDVDFQVLMVTASGLIVRFLKVIAIFWASAHRRSYEAVDSVEQHEKGMIAAHLERRQPYSERNSVVLRIALSSIPLQIRFP